MNFRGYKILIGLAVALMAIIIFACGTERTVSNLQNQPPETHLFLRVSDTLQYLGETTSMQVLHWYGDDSDGEITGFEWAWDDSSIWNYTSDVMDTFFVPIRVAQDTFTFFIRAIDNLGARDPSPDFLAFPIRNSPPRVAFPIDFTQKYSRSVYNSFSYFTIGWSGSDPDGDETITGYDWYLADSSFYPDTLNYAAWDTVSWNHLDSLTNVKVFDALSPGSYRFFLRCKDVAGSYSPMISYPAIPDSTRPGGIWNVMPVVGEILYVDDNIYFFSSDSINVNNALMEIMGPDGYSTWDLRDTISYYPQDIEATLKLFDVVIWNGGAYPSFKEAGNPITNYVAWGGHLFAWSTHAAVDTTLYPFIPMDSVITEAISRVFTVTRTAFAPPGFPDTMSSSIPLSFSFGFDPGSPFGLIPGQVIPLYVYQSDTVAAVYYPPGETEARIVYFSMYIFDCNIGNRFEDLLRHILEVEFSDARH